MSTACSQLIRSFDRKQSLTRRQPCHLIHRRVDNVHLLEPLSSQRLVLWGLLDGLGCYHGIENHRILPLNRHLHSPNDARLACGRLLVQGHPLCGTRARFVFMRGGNLDWTRLVLLRCTHALAHLLALLTFNHLQRCTGKRPSIELVRRHRCCTTCGSLLLTLLACRMLQSAHRTEQHIELIDSHLPQSLRNETTTITTMRRMEPKPVASSDSPPLKVRSPLSLAIVHSRLQ